MKHIIILGDGMADHPVERLGGKTLLQYANKPYMDMLAKKGKTGRLVTVPDGFHPGSEVANSSIMGYDQNEVYEGRGPLEAASIGYELEPTDLALRCNIINVQDGKIITHNGGNLETEDADVLIKYLNDTLGKKYPDVKFVTGIQYRHLLVVKHGNKHIDCAPPHDHPNEEWHKLMVKPILPEIGGDEGHISRRDTADLLNQLILESQELLEKVGADWYDGGPRLACDRTMLRLPYEPTRYPKADPPPDWPVMSTSTRTSAELLVLLVGLASIDNLLRLRGERRAA